MREHAVDIADFMSDNLFVSLKVKPRKFKNTNINKKKIKAKILILNIESQRLMKI